jgi:hypothetical protein
VLRACRHLLRPGGTIAYTTIVATPGLDQPQQREAIRVGPPAVEATAPNDVLMHKAGFVDVTVTDVTSVFLDTARAWLREFERHEADVKVILGEASWADRQASRASIASGIENGLLRRSLVSGRVLH